MSKTGARALRKARALSVVAPVRSPEDLEKTFSPHPTISSWISGMVRGEIRWAQIEAITRNAEMGLTEQWGDLTRRMLKSDAHIASTVRTYIAAVAGGRRELIARDVDPELKAIAVSQAEACEAMLNGLPDFERSIAEMIDADFVGYSGQEIMWEPRGEWLWPYALEWLHPGRFRFSQSFTAYLWDNGRAVSKARELGLSNADDGIDGLGLPLLPNKYMMHMPRIIPDYPQASGLFLALLRPWWVKSFCVKFMLAGAEIAGNPRMLGVMSDQGSPDAVRLELYNALQQMSADSIGIVSGGSSVQILDPKMQGNGSIWDMVIKFCDAAISKAVLGSTLNVEVGDAGGNRSLGESQADMTIAPRWSASATLVCNTIESQLLRPFLELNRHLWGGHVFVPQMLIHITEDEPSVDDLVINAGIVTKDQLLRSRKLPPLGKEKGGEEFVKPAPAAGGFGAFSAALPMTGAGPATGDARC